MGILVKAKGLGLIDAVMPVVRRMEREGIFFSDGSKERVRLLSGE